MSNKQWVTKYEDVGIDDSWFTPITKKYCDEKVDLIDSRFDPVNTIHEPQNNIPEPPTKLGEVESALITYDIIIEFTSALPTADNELYDIYNEMTDHSDITISTSFATFYTDVKSIQLNDIQNMEWYLELEKAYTTHLRNILVGVDEKWLIRDAEYEYVLHVIQNNTDQGLTVYGQITNAPDGGEFDRGEYVTIEKDKLIKKVNNAE